MMRRIHPDYHMPPFLTDLAAEMDAAGFAETLHASHVDSVVLFAKCMYGFCYYDTRVGRKHPGLGARDMLGPLASSCRARGITSLAYVFPLADQAVCAPDADHVWKQRDPDGAPFWAHCPTSPYLDEVLLPELVEVARGYEVDGFHVDGNVVRPGGCWCPRCREAMSREGVDTAEPVAVAEHARRTLNRMLGRMTETLRAVRPKLILSYNNILKIGCRPQAAWSDVVDLELNLLESDRSHVGQVRASLYGRHVRTLGRRFAVTGSCRSRGVAAYGSLAPAAELRHAAALSMALGGYCQLINEMLPEGTLEPAVMARIGEAFGWLRDREPWAQGATPVRHVAILGVTVPGPGWSGVEGGAASGEGLLGATRACIEAHLCFDVVDEEEDLAPYGVVVVPEPDGVTAGTWDRLGGAARRGATLLVAGSFRAAPSRAVEDLLGARWIGPGDPLAFVTPDADGCRGLPAMARQVRGRWDRVTPIPGATDRWWVTRARRADRGDRIGHGFIPERAPSPWPALLQTRRGAGRVLYSPLPLFQDYAATPDAEQGVFVGNLVALAAPQGGRPVVFRSVAPGVETSVMSQEGRWVIHLVRGGGEASGVVRGVGILARPPFQPSVVYRAPDRAPLPYRVESEGVEIELETLGEHELVVIES